MAHAMWPFIFSFASEKFARLEVDPGLIEQELGHLTELLSTPEFHSVEEIIEQIIDEYIANDLAFGYEHRGVQWIAFDKHFPREYASAEDKASPGPPEPAYTDWLKKLHGDDWAYFHPDNRNRPGATVPEDLHNKRAEAGRAGAKAKWRGKTDDTLPDLPLDASLPPVGVGVGTGIGTGKSKAEAAAKPTPLTNPAPQVKRKTFSLTDEDEFSVDEEPKPAAKPEHVYPCSNSNCSDCHQQRMYIQRQQKS